LEHSDNPGFNHSHSAFNPERVPLEANPFRVSFGFIIVNPELEHSDNSGFSHSHSAFNPERVPLEANPFRVSFGFIIVNPELSLCSNSGLKLANAFGVIRIEAPGKIRG
jgi:hypothetical protein